MMVAVPETHHDGGMQLDELLRELPAGTRIVGDGSVRVRGVRHDSRAVEPGDLFVARKGEKSDGARFAADAVKRGAVAVMAASEAVDVGRPNVPVVVLPLVPVMPVSDSDSSGLP